MRRHKKCKIVEHRNSDSERVTAHEIERAFVFCNGKMITAQDLTEPTTGPQEDKSKMSPALVTGSRDEDLPTLNEVENRGIRDALARFNGNKKRAAESLGISRSYLYKRLFEMNDG